MKRILAYTGNGTGKKCKETGKRKKRRLDKTCHIISTVGKNKRGRKEGGGVRKSKAR